MLEDINTKKKTYTRKIYALDAFMRLAIETKAFYLKLNIANKIRFNLFSLVKSESLQK